MSLPDLLILRHGETQWNLAGRLQGALDSPLTPRGRAQADAQGRILARFGIESWTIWSSPQGRAVATAERALGPGADMRLDPRLAEIGMGRWTGLQRAQIAAQMPHLFGARSDLGWYDHAPEGEGLAALHKRTGAFLADLDGPAIIVTHGITSRMLRCHALGLAPEAFGDLPGGQGIIYHLSGGMQTCLTEGA